MTPSPATTTPEILVCLDTASAELGDLIAMISSVLEAHPVNLARCGFMETIGDTVVIDDVSAGLQDKGFRLAACKRALETALSDLADR